MRYSNEPFFWAMFSAGGMILALVLPALIVATGLLLPAEEIDFPHLFDVLDNWFIRLVILGVAFLTFFHSAHRIRHTAVDLGLRNAHTPVSIVSYAVAALLTLWALTVVI